MIKIILRATALFGFALLAFIASMQLDVIESSVPVGTQYKVELTVTGSSLDKGRAIAGLDGLADERGLQIDKIVPDPDDFLHGRSLYRFGADAPHSPRPLRWYDPSWHGVMASSSQLQTASLDGSYAVSGDADGIQALRQWATEYGAPISILPQPGWIAMTMAALSYSGAYGALLAIVLLLTAALVTWYASRARGTSLKVLAGATAQRIALDELLRLGSTVLLTATIGAVAAAAVIGIRSGLEYVSAFFQVYLPLAIGLIIFLLMMAALISMVGWPSVIQLASRISPLKSFRKISEATKVLILVCAMLFLPVAINTIGAGADATASSSRWTALKDQLSINNFGVAPGADQAGVIDSAFRDVVADADLGGHVALGFEQPTLSRPDAVDASSGPFDGIYYANPAYLKLFGISLDATSTGSHLEPIAADEIPPSVREAYGSSLQLQLAEPETFDPDSWAPFEVHGYHGEEGFPAVTFEGSARIKTLTNPLVLLVDAPGKAMSAGFLAAATSRTGILFDDRDILTGLLAAHGLADKSTSLDRAADTGLVQLQLLTRTLYFQVAAAVVFLLALAFSCWLSASTWAASRARTLIPLRVSGLSWARILRLRIVWELSVAVVLTTVATFAMSLADASPAVWWTLFVPVGYGILTSALHIDQARRVFRRTVGRNT